MGDRSKGGGFDDVTDREGASTVGPEAPPPPSNEASSKAVPRPVDTPPELLLIGKHPEDVLAKIVDGDPLGLTELCTERIQVRAVFLEPTRLVRRTFARVAYEACRDPNRGKPTLHGWILARVDQALGELIAEDRDDEWRGVPIDPSHETLAFYHDIARKLLLEPSATRRACIRFNLLDEVARQAFWTVILDEVDVENCLELGFNTVEEVQTHLHEAMVVFLEAGLGDRL